VVIPAAVVVAAATIATFPTPRPWCCDDEDDDNNDDIAPSLSPSFTVIVVEESLASTMAGVGTSTETMSLSLSTAFLLGKGVVPSSAVAGPDDVDDVDEVNDDDDVVDADVGDGGMQVFPRSLSAPVSGHAGLISKVIESLLRSCGQAHVSSRSPLQVHVISGRHSNSSSVAPQSPTYT